MPRLKQVHYNKLIRDRIPGVMRFKGKQFSVRVLGQKEFGQELLKKLLEEAREVAHATSKAELTSELADVMDVIEEVCRIRRISKSTIKKQQKKHLETKGGFKKQYFLEWSEDDGYKNHPGG